MKKQYRDHDKPMDDAVLHYSLKRHDPVAPPSQAFLAALEVDIIATIDGRTRNHIPSVTEDSRAPVWLCRQGWEARVAAFAAVIIIASGFILGQLSYGEFDVSSPTGTPSLLAFADEGLSQSIPAATDISWGDSNEDDE